MTETKPIPTPDAALIDKIEKAAEAAAHRGVNAAVQDAYAGYGPKVLAWEAVTFGGSLFAALVLWSALKWIGGRLRRA